MADHHHSQPVRADDVESPEERAQRTGDEATLRIQLQHLDRRLDEQIKLSRESNSLTRTLIAKTGNTEATLAIKAIGAEVAHIRAVSHVNEATLFAVCEVRDELRGLNGRADETNRLLGVLANLLSNGHATH